MQPTILNDDLSGTESWVEAFEKSEWVALELLV